MMTGTTVCGVCGSWVWGCGGIDVDEGEVALSDNDDGGSADVEGNMGIVELALSPLKLQSMMLWANLEDPTEWRWRWW